MVLILKRQQPFLILFLVLSVLSGLAFLVSAGGSDPVPHWLAAAWAAGLFVTGCLGLAGIAWQRWNVLRGIAVTRGVLMLQAGLVTAYGGLLGLYLRPMEWVIILAACGTWAFVNLWESRLMARDLGRVEAADER